ncbi:MAG: CvpA family protein [Chromatiales bacterium]|jgi:membrane protein required for colicin V production
MDPTILIWVDYIIIGIIAVSALISLFRGFIKEAFSLLVWVAAFWLSWTFFRDLSQIFVNWVTLPSARLGISFALIMVGTLIVGGLVNFLLSQLVEHTGLSGTDRVLGVFFGLARGVVIIAIIVLLAGLTPFPQDPWWRESQLLGYFEEISLWLKTFLPEEIASTFSYGQ